jgi:2-methylisocitrate lyase-like PEP mutase family enzyme
MTEPAQLHAVQEAAGGLPLVVNTAVGSAEEMAAKGVRLFFQGHQAYFVMLRALLEAYETLLAGAPPSALAEKALTPEQLAIALDEAEYARLAKDYLGT